MFEPDPDYSDCELDGASDRYQSLQYLIYEDSYYNRSIQKALPLNRAVRTAPLKGRDRVNSSRVIPFAVIPAVKPYWRSQMESIFLRAVWEAEEPLLIAAVCDLVSGLLRERFASYQQVFTWLGVSRSDELANKVIWTIYQGGSAAGMITSLLSWWRSLGVIHAEWRGRKLVYSAIPPEQRTLIEGRMVVIAPGSPLQRYGTLIEVEKHSNYDVLVGIVELESGLRERVTSELAYMIPEEFAARLEESWRQEESELNNLEVAV